MLRDLLRARRIFFFFGFFVVEWFVNWLRVSGFTYERIKCKTTLLVCSILFAPSSIISRLPINIWTVVCFAVESLIASGNVYLFGSVWDFNGSASTTNKHSIAQNKNLRQENSSTPHNAIRSNSGRSGYFSESCACLFHGSAARRSERVWFYDLHNLFDWRFARARASRRPHCAGAFLAQLKSQINID